MATRAYQLNINKSLVKEWEIRHLAEIVDAKVEVLQGIDKVGQSIFHDGFARSNHVDTVGSLAQCKFYRVARAIVDLRDAEEDGARDPKATMNLNNALIKEWETKTLKEICAAPIYALQGVSEAAAERFKAAPLHVQSIEDLAKLKYCRWAAAIAELAAYEVPSGASRAAMNSPPKKARRSRGGSAELDRLIDEAKQAESRATAAEAGQAAATAAEKVEKAAMEASEKRAQELQATLAQTIKQMEALSKSVKQEVDHKVELARKKWMEQGAKAAEAERKFGGVFDKIDANGDGVLSLEELKRYVAEKDLSMRLSLGIGRWEEFLVDVDEDGDGKVSREEFIKYFGSHELDAVVCYGALFDAMDANFDGELDYEEILQYKYDGNPKIFQLLGIWQSLDGSCKGWDSFVRSIDPESGKVTRDNFMAHFCRREAKGMKVRRQPGDEHPATKKARTA